MDNEVVLIGIGGRLWQTDIHPDDLGNLIYFARSGFEVNVVKRDDELLKKEYSVTKGVLLERDRLKWPK